MEKGEIFKYFAFGVIVILVLGITAYLIWSTITTNVKSVTGGPVHWHADFEIFSCGQKIDLIDPQGWDNKVGTPFLHEHNDGRIHVEGPVLAYQNVSLGKFFEVVGGKLDRNSLVVPTNIGMVKVESGMDCNGEPAELQVFVYRTEGKFSHQQKLEDPANYVLSPYSTIPPGDCTIIEFDSLKDKTDKICTFYKVALQKGEILKRGRE